MRHILKSLSLGVFLLVPVMTSPLAPKGRDATACGVIQEALIASQQIKTGTARADVERRFIRDGGAQFRSATRYVYRRCSYLHLDVDFEMIGAAGISPSPEDKVVKVSKLYVDYSAKD